MKSAGLFINLSSGEARTSMHLPRILLIALLFTVSVRAQQVLEVPGAFPSIQAAIDAAQDGDTVLITQNVNAANVSLRGKRLTIEGALIANSRVVISVSTGSSSLRRLFSISGPQPAGTTFRNLGFSGLLSSGVAVGGSLAGPAHVRFEQCGFIGNSFTLELLRVGSNSVVELEECMFFGTGDVISSFIQVSAGGQTTTQLHMERCTLSMSQLGFGFPARGMGIISATGAATITFDSCLWSGAFAPPGRGSCLALRANSAGAPDVTLRQCTLTDYFSVPVTVDAGTLTVESSIVWDPTFTGWFDSTDTAAVSLNLSRSDLNSGAPTATALRTVTASDVLDIDPQFRTPRPVSPRLPPWSLDRRSPLIDAGDPTANPAELDLGGSPRVQDGDTNGSFRTDIGAYEYVPAVITAFDVAGPGGTLQVELGIDDGLQGMACLPVGITDQLRWLPGVGLQLFPDTVLAEPIFSGNRLTIPVPLTAIPVEVFGQALVMLTDPATGQTFVTSTNQTRLVIVAP